MPLQYDVSDLALIELLNEGKTDCPDEVLAQHLRRGYIESGPAGIALTAEGRDRATRLRGVERNLRTQIACAQTGSPLRCVSIPSVTGSPRRRK